MSAPVVTVDTPEFCALLTRLNMCAGQKEIDRTRKDIIRSADAHTARAVAAADKAARQNLARVLGLGVNEARSFAWDYLLTLVAAAVEDQPAAQPVAGELPPLPKHLDYRAGKTAEYSADQMLEYGRLCRAAQSMQQHAAVPDQTGDIFDLIREWTQLPEGQRHDAARNIIGHLNQSYLAGFRDAESIYKKPAAVVGQEPAPRTAMDRVLEWEGFQRISDIPAVHEALQDFSDDPTGDNGVYVVREVLKAAATVPAAGVQGDDMSGMWEEADIRGGETDCQPDSGRDAALEEAAKACEEFDMHGMALTIRELAAHPAPSSDTVEVFTIPHITSRGDKFVLLSEVHPAPSSDVALTEYFAEVDGEYQKVFLASDVLAAHPANGAQAADAKRLDILIRYCGSDRFCLIDQRWHFLDPRGRIAGIGVTQREAIDAAILAASKKGG